MSSVAGSPAASAPSSSPAAACAVVLHEMRPQRSTPAHRATGLRGAGVLELAAQRRPATTPPGCSSGRWRRSARWCSARRGARRCRPVRRSRSIATRFAAAITETLERHPRIALRREEVTELPPGDVVIATGPLTSPALARSLQALLGEALYFYDAIAPIVEGESLDLAKLFRASRYGKGDGDDYLNAPIDREQYAAFHHAIVEAEVLPLHDFEQRALLRGLPADRGDGAARRRHAALRADEAGRTARPGRPAAVGGGAAAPGEPGPEPVQPGRLPVAHEMARAAARVPHDPRPRARRVRASRADPPQHLRQLAAPPRRDLSPESGAAPAPRRSAHRRRGLSRVGGDRPRRGALPHRSSARGADARAAAADHAHWVRWLAT